MSIKIEKDHCIGCGRCVEVCPGNLIHLDENRKAEIRRVRDCWGCTSCIKACSTNAILFFLGEDVGGTGATLSVSRRGRYLDWEVDRPDGTSQVIRIDRSESNKY